MDEQSLIVAARPWAAKLVESLGDTQKARMIESGWEDDSAFVLLFAAAMLQAQGMVKEKADA